MKYGPVAFCVSKDSKTAVEVTSFGSSANTDSASTVAPTTHSSLGSSDVPVELRMVAEAEEDATCRSLP